MWLAQVAFSSFRRVIVLCFFLKKSYVLTMCLDPVRNAQARPRVVEIMGEHLGWDAGRRERETREAAAFIASTAGVHHSADEDDD
jgi:hypothetical protein